MKTRMSTQSHLNTRSVSRVLPSNLPVLLHKNNDQSQVVVNTSAIEADPDLPQIVPDAEDGEPKALQPPAEDDRLVVYQNEDAGINDGEEEPGAAAVVQAQKKKRKAKRRHKPADSPGDWLAYFTSEEIQDAYDLINRGLDPGEQLGEKGEDGDKDENNAEESDSNPSEDNLEKDDMQDLLEHVPRKAEEPEVALETPTEAQPVRQPEDRKRRPQANGKNRAASPRFEEMVPKKVALPWVQNAAECPSLVITSKNSLKAASLVNRANEDPQTLYSTYAKNYILPVRDPIRKLPPHCTITELDGTKRKLAKQSNKSSATGQGKINIVDQEIANIGDSMATTNIITVVTANGIVKSNAIAYATTSPGTRHVEYRSQRSMPIQQLPQPQPPAPTLFQQQQQQQQQEVQMLPRVGRSSLAEPVPTTTSQTHLRVRFALRPSLGANDGPSLPGRNMEGMEGSANLRLMRNTTPLCPGTIAALSSPTRAGQISGIQTHGVLATRTAQALEVTFQQGKPNGSQPLPKVNRTKKLRKLFRIPNRYGNNMGDEGYSHLALAENGAARQGSVPAQVRNAMRPTASLNQFPFIHEQQSPPPPLRASPEIRLYHNVPT
jgi:hypothetical protein